MTPDNDQWRNLNMKMYNNSKNTTYMNYERDNSILESSCQNMTDDVV